MKRMICLFVALLLVIPCSGVAAQMVSIVELRDQARSMSRWEEEYQVGNTVVHVDIPIIVPDVDYCPIAVVEGKQTWLLDTLAGLVSTSTVNPKNDSQYFYTLSGDEEWIEGENGDTLTFYDPNEMTDVVRIKYNDVDGKLQSKTTKAYRKDFAWAFDPDTVYAEDNPATYSEAESKAVELARWVYPDEEIGIYVKEVTVYDRMRKGSKGKGVGDPVDGSQIGSYLLRCDQTLFGIPISRTVERDLNNWVLYTSDAVLMQGAGSIVTYVADDVYEISTHGAIAAKDIRHADVPVASLDDVITAIENEIYTGHILDVESLELNYILCRDQKGENWVYPAWAIHCIYVENPKKGLRKDFGSASGDFSDVPEYGLYPIFAQTAEFGNPSVIEKMTDRKKGEGQCFDLPRILTWEEVR